jgi:hypothetical protein
MRQTFHALLFKINLGGLSNTKTISYQGNWQQVDEK